MWELLGVVIPLAIGAAISPTIAALQITMLGSDSHPRWRARAYLLGAFVALLLWAAIVLTAVWSVVQSLETDVNRTIAQYTRAIDLVLGAGLVAFGVWKWVRPKRKSAREPRFSFSALLTGPLWRQVLLGFIMQVRNVTTVILYCAALQRISSSRLPLYEQIPIICVVIGITLAAVWLPMLIPIRTTEDAKTRLLPAGTWLQEHERPISITAALVFGCYLFLRAVF